MTTIQGMNTMLRSSASRGSVTLVNLTQLQSH